MKQPQCEPLIPQFNSAQLNDSVARLDTLASAISIFKARYDDLRSHLDFIDKSIDERCRLKGGVSPPDKATVTQHCEELKFLCETNNGKLLRKYIIRHRLHEVDMLREELPIAIKASQNPAKLVLECAGKFFKQGSRAYEKDQALVQTRMVGVLALEALLLAVAHGGVEVDEESRNESEDLALLWRKRLIAEGGVSNASEMDARGLLFLICGYGIPKDFGDNNIWDLVTISMKENCATLKCSSTLTTRLTGILEKMMENKMKIEALEVVRTFGMEEMFPSEKILSSYIEECNRSLNQRRTESKSNSILQRRAFANHIDALKSALKFVIDRQFESLKDPLQEAITKMENESQNTEKRRLSENGTARNHPYPTVKRLRFDSAGFIGKGTSKMMMEHHNVNVLNGRYGVSSSYDGMPMSYTLAPMEIRSLITQPSSGMPPATTLDGLPGFLSSPRGVGDDRTAIDPYAFVDKVLELEFGRVHRIPSPPPPLPATHRPPSYLRL